MAREAQPSATYSAADIARVLGRGEPTPEQRRIIEAPLRSMLVVAGAGSGKTETMAARVVWLVANGLIAPEEVLGLTFTRKAAAELAARISSRLRALATAGLWAGAAAPDVVDAVPGARTAAPLSSPRPGELDISVPLAAPRAAPRSGPTAEPDEGAAVVSTYHAYAGRIVQEHGLRLGIEPDARLLTEAAAWQLAHEVVTAYDGAMEEVPYAEATVTRAVVALSGELAEHLRDIDEVADYYAAFQEQVAALPMGASRARNLPKQVADLVGVVAARRQLVPIVAAYAAAKRARGCLDFADQVAVAARLARDFPEVAAHERDRFRVVLLDEFQDTSEAQLVLLRSLFADATKGPVVPVVAVGDPHQSIYGWRGASATTLARFPRLFGAPVLPARRRDAAVQASLFDDPPEAEAAAARDPGREDGASDSASGEGAAEIRHLSVSWRNPDRVLAVANRVAKPLTDDSPIAVRRLQPAPGAGAGQVEAARLTTMADEARYVAARIAAEWFAADGRPTGATAAVLCRRRMQFVPIVDALRARDLPVEVVGLGGLLTMPEVQDVVALLSVVADPARGDRLMRLLTGPAYRLGAADLDGLAAWARHLQRRDQPPGAPTGTPRGSSGGPEERAGIVEAIEELPPAGWTGPEGEALGATARIRLRELADIVRRLRGLADGPLPEVCAEAERLLGLDVELLARPDLPPDTARVHLDAFADAAAGFAATADRPTLGAFLAWLEIALDEERGLEAPAAAVSADAVQVLTVHAAKGLEWDVVAVPGLVEGAFPSTGAVSAKGDPASGVWTIPQARDKGWCVGLERLPYELRGDADGLPALRWRSVPDLATLETELTATYLAGGARMVAEERRLAYVAFTRARRVAILTAPVWTDAGTPRVTSRFLTEVLAAADDLVRVGPWADMPVPDEKGRAAHPGTGRPDSAAWPFDPLAARRALIAPGARVLAEELATLPADPEGLAARVEAEVLAGARAGSPGDLELLALLRERRSLADQGRPALPLPEHLSTSSLVALYADERAFAEQLRRPMPAPPATRARSGSAFHAWVEEHYQRAAILDVTDLPGSGDADDVLDLADAKAHFLAGPWAAREPLDVELALETHLAGVAVRGRIDAVFADEPGPGVVVVDWKTGHPPTGSRARAAAVQLGVYRLAYARLRGIPPERVRGAFYYVATGETVFPELPGEAELTAVLRGDTALLTRDRAADREAPAVAE